MSYILPGKGDVHRCVASNPYTVQKFLQNANFFVKKKFLILRKTIFFSKVKHGRNEQTYDKVMLMLLSNYVYMYNKSISGA